MPDNPCDGIKGRARDYCEWDGEERPIPGEHQGGGMVDSASQAVKDLVDHLCESITDLVAPKSLSAPATKDHELYAPMLWLGEHITVAIFICVVVTCALTAWQGMPRLRQLGHTTGYSMIAIAVMGAIPPLVDQLNKAVAKAFNIGMGEGAGLFAQIQQHLEQGGDAGNPLAQLLLLSALAVTLMFAGLVYLVRTPGILVFVLMSPLILASLAREGNNRAVLLWMNRLLGLICTPFILLIVTPATELTGGSLVLDVVLLLGADLLMLRMVWVGVPYVGPRIAMAARGAVERRTDSPIARAVMRVGVPTVYEQENGLRNHRVVPTPGRAVHQDSNTLLGAYGIKRPERPGRLTTASTIAQVQEGAERTAAIAQARRQARTTHAPASGAPRTTGPAATPAAPVRSAGPAPARPAGPTTPSAPPAPRTPPNP
ncbi:hypothetical protein JHN53_17240 [Streptomyces sp. MBT58]|uniref:hypothetical protein n=1 Tax=Streptomyces sp. MBT58 TaxID=1488389 RepID=UPI001911A25A|nr:hypothetical protein [Streptomyces sp. MBT58]MBK5993356.1 hypothetical protein [Streptomyces sp. MBT58]